MTRQRLLLIITGAFYIGTTLLYWLLGQIFPGTFLPSGDEPHYLLISQTLLKYHSLDVMQAYQHSDYTTFYTLPLAPHIAKNVYGQTLPLHSIGAPVLWLIPFWLLGRLGAMLFMTGVSLLVVYNIYRFLLLVPSERETDQEGERKRRQMIAFRVSLLYAIASPFYIYSHLDFIEPLGALATIYLLRLCFQTTLTSRQILLASLVLGLLPWVHARFALFEMVLFCALLVRIWRLYRLERWLYYVCLLLPVAILFGLLEAYSYFVWGTLNPVANQISGGSTPFEVAPWGGLLGILFDQEHGILIAFPLFILLIAGIVLTPRRRLWGYHLLAVLLSVPYILMFTSFRHWSGGWCPPARFMLPLLPIYALYLAWGLNALPQKWSEIIWKGSLYYGLLYGLVSLLPYDHGFSAETGTSNTLAFLNLSGLRITDLLPTVYKFERWPVMVFWMLLYIGCTALFLFKSARTKKPIKLTT